MEPPEQSLLVFPCEFSIKIIGKQQDGFRAIVVEVITRHAPDFDETRITIRQSGGGKYIAMTATVVAGSREQLDAIYSELSASPYVNMML